MKKRREKKGEENRVKGGKGLKKEYGKKSRIGEKGEFEDEEDGGVEGYLRERRKAEIGGLQEEEMGGREVWEEEEDRRKGRI